MRDYYTHIKHTLIILFCVFMSTNVSALSIQTYPIQSLFNSSQWIVYARITKATTSRMNQRLITRFEINVLENFKDIRSINSKALNSNTISEKASESNTHSFSILGGTLNGITQKIPGNPTFKIGERMILFLRCQPQNPCTPVGMEQGVWRSIKINESLIKDPLSIWISDFERQHDLSLNHDHKQRITMAEFIQYLQKSNTEQDFHIEQDSSPATNTTPNPNSVNTIHKHTNTSQVSP
jgi:hypothetical protein